jgi:hypothetical protein
LFDARNEILQQPGDVFNLELTAFDQYLLASSHDFGHEARLDDAQEHIVLPEQQPLIDALDIENGRFSVSQFESHTGYASVLRLDHQTQFVQLLLVDI